MGPCTSLRGIRHSTSIPNHTTHLSNSCRYLIFRTFLISTLESLISSSACLCPHVSPLLPQSINHNSLLLEQLLHTRSHRLRIDLHPNPTPLQRNSPHVQIPRVRSDNRGIEQASLAFLTKILHTTYKINVLHSSIPIKIIRVVKSTYIHHNIRPQTKPNPIQPPPRPPLPTPQHNLPYIPRRPRVIQHPRRDLAHRTPPTIYHARLPTRFHQRLQHRSQVYLMGSAAQAVEDYQHRFLVIASKGVMFIFLIVCCSRRERGIRVRVIVGGNDEIDGEGSGEGGV